MEKGKEDKAVCMMKTAYERVYQFKITLRGIRPPIWRRIQVPETYSFWDLHVAIQGAMGWMDCHLHEFTMPDARGGGPVRIGTPSAEYGFHEVLPEERQSISGWFSVEGKPAEYTYDFGDDWVHTVKLEKILPREEGVDYPHCVKGKRACPPEDCGGPWGYMQLLEVLADPRHEEYEETLEWLDGEFEAELFHPDSVVFPDPDKWWEYAQGGWGAPATDPAGGAMEEEDEDAGLRVEDLLKRIRAGGGRLAPFKEELEELLPGSMLAAAAALDEGTEKHARGEMAQEELEELVRSRADLHPLNPAMFEMCAAFAIARGDEHDVLGYTALTVLKSERWLELTGESYAENAPDDTPEVFREFMEMVAARDDLQEAAPHIEKGGDHLVNHFLVEDILRSDWGVEEDIIMLALERSERVTPIAIAMCGDLMERVDADLHPPGLVFLLRLIGHLKPIEALPVLLRALEYCIAEPLHEAVLALAKLGSFYPGEVSAGLREVAGNPDMGEARLGAIEALGMLGDVPGNAEFLMLLLEEFDPDDDYADDLFIFLTCALLLHGGDDMVDATARALERHRSRLGPYAIEHAESYLEEREFPVSGCLLEGVACEDILDLMEMEPEPEIAARRLTLTGIRETGLASLAEDDDGEEYGGSDDMLGGGGEFLPDRAWLEEQLKTGRNEPCPCGSGRKFKKCCLPALEGLLDTVMRGMGGDAGMKLYDALLMALMDFTEKPSYRMEKREAIGEFNRERERICPGMAEGAGPEEEGLETMVLMDWLFFCRPLASSGKTIAREFGEKRGGKLDSGLASMLRGMMSGRFSIYEIEEVRPGKSLVMRDIFRGVRFEVREKTASGEAVRWDLVATRVGEEGGHPVILGSSFRVPRRFLPAMESFVREESERLVNGGEVADMEEYLQRKGYCIFHRLMGLLKDEGLPIVLTAEGDELCFCTATFKVKDPARARELLEGHPYIEPDEEEEGSGAREDGACRYVWFMSREMEDELRAGEHRGAANQVRSTAKTPREWEEDGGFDDERTVLRLFGSLKLEGDAIEFMAQSRERLEVGKRELARLMPGILTHQADDFADAERIMHEAVKEGAKRRGGSRRAPVGAETPAGAENGFAKGLLDLLYGDWPDTPIPFLGGKTPREAARTPEGRHELNRLLKDYENRNERAARDGYPAYEVGRLRRELGIRPDE